MDPNQQQPEQQPQPQTPPARPRKPAPPAEMPKLSLEDLAGKFKKEKDNKALDGTARVFAGWMHQVIMHLQIMRLNVWALGEARKTDLEQIDGNFQQIGGLLQQLTGAPDGSAEGTREGSATAPQPEPAAAEPAPGPEVVGAAQTGEPMPAVALPRQPQPPPKRARTNGTTGA